MDLHQDQELENLEHGCDEGIQSLLIEQLKENGDYVVESSSLSDDECDSEKATRSDGSSIYSTPTLSPSSSFASFKSCLSTLEDDEAGEESGKIMDGDEPRVVSPHERDVKVLRESWSENGDNNSPKNFGDELEDTISPALSFLQSQMQSIDKDPGFYLSREYNWSMVTPDGLNEENNREKGDNQLPFNTITTDPLIWLPPHQEQDLTVDSEQAMPWIEKNRAANQLPVDTIMNDPLVLLPPVKEHDLAAESEQTIPLTEEDKATYQLPIDTIAADSLVLLPPGKEHDFTAESEQTMPLTEEDKATNQLPIEIIAADSFVLLPPDKEHDLTAESEQAMLLTEENKATNQLPIEIIAADSFVLLPPDKEHDFTAESEQTIPLTEEDKATYQLPIDTIAADSLVLLPPGKEHDFTAESEQTMPLTEEDKATNQLPIEIIAADSFVLLPPDKEHDLTAESEQAMLLTEENKATNQLPIEIIAADSFVLLPPDKEHDFTAESEQTIPLTEEDKATYQLPIDTIAADSLVLLPPGKEHDFTAESEQTMPLTEEDKATNQLPIEIIAADSFVLLPPDKEHDLTAESEQAMLLTEENKATNQLPIDTIAADPLTCLSPDQGHDLTVESERAMPLTEEDKAINKLLFQTITADPLVWLPPYQEQDLTAESENPMTMIEDNKERVCLKQEPDKALMDAMKCRFKFLVSQFLAAEEVPTVEESGDSWLEVVSALSWEASQLIRPNLNDGNAMDPGLYIKVKCVACGSPSHSQLIKGLVFKKNTAHRHMQSSFTNPRLLLFKGALGHEAVCLSSFDSMEKEKKYSKFMIEMIDACRPDIILVEKSVSRDILESLLERRISVVIDMKLHRLKRISICTGSPIISSADILTSPELKQCDLFYIEKFFEDHAGQSGGGKRQNKTLMFFDGCPRPLGCTILASRNLHPEIRVADGKGSNSRGFSVICLFPEEFHRLRSFNCSSEAAYVASIGRCKAWDAQGGKSGAIFAKSLDGWLVIKQISRTELESFVKFAPDYFKYVSSSFCSGSQTCLARILGIYQVKQTKNGRETKIYLVVMENLLHGRLMSRVYDLKGAVFSRHVAEGDNPGKVLLDQNFVQDMVAQPIYFTIPSKRLLQRAIWNDTSFLTAVGVMDYSLLIGVDEGKREVMFGIIDYLRQYTWDKKLENWAKASWVVPKNEQPTVISPREYQKRFRKFMSRYFLTIPHEAITSAVEGMLDGS
ncbi:uncharacterized protein LOC144715992 isoform X7 [Wolffia australiana]